MDILQLKYDFLQIFGGSEAELRVFYSPGRVNLIGEHTDYNGGHVFPCALSFGIYGVARKRSDNILRFASGNINCPVSVKLDNLVYDKTHNWANYPKGVVLEFIKLNHEFSGFDLYVWGNIPNGAGLSSSASLEVLTAVVVNSLFDLNVSMKEIALLSQRAENKFVGVNCGIMDQYSIALGKKNHAMFLNCQTLTHKYVPLELAGYKIIIANTNKKRGLLDSKYNERRSECDKALKLLQRKNDIKSLCELTPEDYERDKYLIKDQTIRYRAEHVIYENACTIQAVAALENGDLARFGELMTTSHKSLYCRYEVTGLELDALVDSALKVEGVLGSRMTGAGFGGCTVSIVNENCVQDFITSVSELYPTLTGLVADFYIAETGCGAKEIV